MKRNFRRRHATGFTMMEVLIVMTIIAILAALSVGGLMFVKEKQKNSKAEIQIGLIAKGIQDYELDNGDFPGDENAGGSNGTNESNMLFQALYYDGYESLESGDESATIYLADLDPGNDTQQWIEGSGSSAEIVDPWKNEYRYRRGTSAMNPDFDIWSSGKDGETAGNGTDDKDKDDITNY
jgi:prepilin-type N-terminal cleavage/methylation domain-containing protein